MTSVSKTSALKVLIRIGITLTFIALLAIPHMTKQYFNARDLQLDPSIYFTLILGIYLCAVPYMAALLSLNKLSNMIIDNTPFSISSEQALRKIAIYALLEIAIAISLVCIVMGQSNVIELASLYLPLFIFVFLCLAVSLLAFVLAELFQKARLIKEDNDMTI